MENNLVQLKRAPRAKAAAGKIERTRKSRPATPGKASSAPSAKQEPELRRALIAEAAYYRAERRGFAAGHELEDWCVAEAEIDARFCDPPVARVRSRKTKTRTD